MLPSRDTPQTDRQIHLLSPTSATVSRALQMRVNSDFFHTTENFLKTPQPQVFVQNANFLQSSWPFRGETVCRLASESSFLPFYYLFTPPIPPLN